MQIFSDKPLSISLVTMSLGFMVCIFFAGAMSPLVNYVSLYFCITGFAGAFNVAFVMMEVRTMPQILGAMVEISVGTGTLLCLAVPFILQQGLEFSVLISFCVGIPLILLLCSLPPPLNEQPAMLEILSEQNANATRLLETQFDFSFGSGSFEM